MPFFAPLMLIGLVAAAAPIILHLLRKRTARRIVWGAWQFLAESMRRKRRKILLEEIILMVVRTAILAFAALAFARPFIPEMGFFGVRGGDKDVVIVLDRSGSMNLPRKDGSTAFSAAVAEARELIELSPQGVSFGLVLGGSVPEILTATPFSSKREVLKLLDGAQPGEGAMDVPRTLEAAGEVLAGGNRLGKEIVIFGDGQGYGWRTEDENAWRRVAKVLSSFARRPPVVWRTLTRPDKVRNAAISAVVPSRQIFGTDRELSFGVTVVNSGSEAFSPGELSLAVDGERIASQAVGQVLPGLSRTIPFTHKFDKPGAHTVVTSLTAADDIAADNAVTNVVTAIDELKVLLVNGRPGTTGFDRPTAYIEASLRPELKDEKSPFLVRPVNVRPSELESTNVFADVAVTILCDVPFLSDKSSDILAKWVSEGGGLLAVPGERTDLAFCTNWTWRAKSVLPAVWTNFVKSSASDLLPTVEGAPVAGRMLFDEGAIFTNELEVVSRMSDGAAAAVIGAFGKGRIGMLAMPLDLEWTGLPARPRFVPFVHNLVYSLTSAKSFGGGESLGWSAREGDVSPLTATETDALAPYLDLSIARLKDDALAAVVGRGFGVEIWRPLAIVVLLLLVAEILLCWFVDRSRAEGGVPPPVSKFRLFLRVVSVLAIAWLLAHVVLVRDVTRKVSRKVAVLTDLSLSMRRVDVAVAEGTNTQSRFDAATNVAERLESALAKKYDVETFSFGGETTDFAAALEEVRTRIAPEEFAGAVFVSDGRPTAGADVEAVSRQLARQGTRVSSVLIGSVTNRPDAAICDVLSAEGIFLGDKVRAQVAIRADELKGAKAVARFMLDDKEIDRRELDIDETDWSTELRFTDEPQEKGVRHYRVVLDVPEQDAEAANNVWPFDVSVSDDRTNVLLVDRRPRWEFRYLRNLFFGRDKSVHLQYLLTEPDGFEGETRTSLAADATRAFGDAEAGALPADREAWRKFDVMIFGDVAPEAIDATRAEDIRYCVEERGAMAVFIAGERNMPLAYQSSPLAALMPVDFTNSQGRVNAEWKSGGYRFAVTGAGYAHDLMKLSQSDAENVRIWESGGEWQRRLDGLTVKTGAETIAFAGDSTAVQSPLIVVQHRGCGRVVFLASDETWRFRYRIGDTYHHRFWGNVIRWGAGVKLRDGNAHVRVGTTRAHYAPEDKVTILARLTDADFLPIDGVKVSCAITDPKGLKYELPLTSRADANGTYEATFGETAAEGDYTVEVTCDEAKRRLGDKWPDRLATGFAVKRAFAPIEFAHLSSDRAVLDEMARLTGGEVALAMPTNPPSANAGLPLDFGAGRGEVVDHVEEHIWNHPAAFVVLALALIVVWILRKRKGLA